MTTSTRQAYPTVNDIEAELSQLDFDPDYARLLEGRDVIVVGPAETMLGTGQGRAIDSFDVVVRFNTAIEYMPFAPELARDVGARTDILYCNTEVLIDRIVGQLGLPRERFPTACEAAGIKYFVGTNNDYTHGATGEGGRRKGEAQLYEFREFVEEQGARARCRMLFPTPAVVRRWLGGYIGRTGFIGIVELLRYPLRSLHVTGMTFYHKGGHLFIKDCVELDPMRNHLGLFPEHMLGHNSYLELQVMRTLVDCFGRRLRLDEHVRRLLEARAADGEPAGG